MSLHCQLSPPPVPEDTARVARAAFPKGNPYLALRDDLGPVFADGDFADLHHPERGRPAYPPWRLALVTLLQFREGLSDRQAAEAVRARIDWKYLLALDLGDAGFDFSILCDFRSRLLAGSAEERLLERVLEACRAHGLLKARGRQRTDSTHVLAAVRKLNRLELLGETLRAALNAIAAAEPDWLRALAPPAWYERYGRRVEDLRLPKAAAAREAYAGQVGDDGFRLLAALDAPGAPPTLAGLPAVAALRTVWRRHFEQERGPDSPEGPGRARPQAVRGRGSEDRLESPYDPEARYRAKDDKEWTGYMVHLTETCDGDAPHLVVHADTTPANVHEAMRTGPIHAALAAKGLAPATHLADAAYISAAHLVAARERFDIDLVGPARANLSWQRREDGAFEAADFHIDWEANRATCPRGKESGSWRAHQDKAGAPYVKVRFKAADCRACEARAQCTKATRTDAGRQLRLHPRDQHEALVAARAREASADDRPLYALRQGVEGTLSQAVRGFGLRCARYRGLAKAHLQHVATAAALDLDRVAAWLQGRPLAPTRISRFAALAA
jgi:transposase